MGITKINVTEHKRSSNIELLRVFSMILIIMNHYCSTIPLSSEVINTHKFNHLLKCALGSWGDLGVNLFIIISIWFLCDVNAKFNLWKLVQIVLETSFYYVSWFVLAGKVLNIQEFSIVGLFKASLAPFLGTYWFVTAYICFYLVMPLLNKLVSNLSSEQLKYSVLMLTISIIFFFMIQGANAEYGVIGVWSYVFLLISYLKREPENFFRKYSGCLTILLYTFIVIGGYVSEVTGLLRVNGMLLNKHSIFIILLAVSIFYCFEKRPKFTSKMINIMASSTFGVYILHAGPIAEKFLAVEVANNMNAYVSSDFGLQVVLYAVVILICGTFIDQVRIYLLEKPVLRLLYCCKRLDQLINFWNCKWGMKE